MTGGCAGRGSLVESRASPRMGSIPATSSSVTPVLCCAFFALGDMKSSAGSSVIFFTMKMSPPMPMSGVAICGVRRGAGGGESEESVEGLGQRRAGLCVMGEENAAGGHDATATLARHEQTSLLRSTHAASITRNEETTTSTGDNQKHPRAPAQSPRGTSSQSSPSRNQSRRPSPQASGRGQGRTAGRAAGVSQWRRRRGCCARRRSTRRGGPSCGRGAPCADEDLEYSGRRGEVR